MLLCRSDSSLSKYLVQTRKALLLLQASFRPHKELSHFLGLRTDDESQLFAHSSTFFFLFFLGKGGGGVLFKKQQVLTSRRGPRHLRIRDGSVEIAKGPPDQQRTCVGTLTSHRDSHMDWKRHGCGPTLDHCRCECAQKPTVQ